ncbi:cation/H(+) antiporter 15-like [Phalaenopsis equestris]|uniref:cation/H(+) antiporter 15-like n=1 Tax=Phalaenopsis equestris TaxID=78828 RepID=UPI0009E196CD|nr:cation/H(+) antiporter 15-like [Phalaenopsis equestris]
MSLEVTPEDFYKNVTAKQERVFCFHAIMTTSSGVWLSDNTLLFSLPLLLYQIVIIFIFTRITHFVLRRFSIPIVISQIIGGIILGPSCLGRLKSFERLLFAPRSWEQLNTISIFSFMLFLFLIGLKTELSMIPKAGKKAFAVAICSSFLPSGIVLLAGILLKSHIPLRFKETFIIVNLASSWSMTSYTVVSCVLADLNLLTSKLGRLAMSATLITEFTNLFISAVIGSYLVGSYSGSVLLGVTTMAAFLGFMAFLVFVARPLTILAIKKTTPEGGMLDEACFVGVILLAIGCGFLSELIGYHATMGPFMLGLMLPGGAPLGVTMVDKLERLVVGVFLPVFLATAGLRMDLWTLGDRVGEWMLLFYYLMLGVLAKFLGGMLPCFYCRMPIRECLAVGLMMISKGIYEIDASCRWQDARIVDRQLFTVLVLAIVAVGGGSAPLIKRIYRPEDRFVAYKRRAIQFLRSNSELRILTCIHGQDHVNAMLTLLDSFHPTIINPVCLYALHLKPLAGRAATLLTPYNRRRSSDTERIFNAFLRVEQLYSGCSILPYVCISPYTGMHEDICSLALDKKVFLIIVPFHKQLAIDGSVSTPIPAIQSVNSSVLRFAPCSVAVLVNHGLATESSAFRSGGIPHAAVYFFGGPDDREALACGLRMSENSSVRLTVVRFRRPNAAVEGTDERMDERMLEDVRIRKADGSRVVYVEKVVRDGEGTVGVIREISGRFSLLLVGRGDGKETEMTSGLSTWSEFAELGTIGDLLSSTDFGGRVSTLVQQQRRVAGSGAPETVRMGRMFKDGVDEDDD